MCSITAIEIAELDPPLAELHPMKALFRIPDAPPPTLAEPEIWSPEFFDFVTKTLQKNPAQRPTSSELLQHPFLLKGKSASAKVKLVEYIARAKEIREKRKTTAIHITTASVTTHSGASTATIDTVQSDVTEISIESASRSFTVCCGNHHE